MYSDRIKETSTTTGTGNLTLAGAATGFKTFNTAFSTNEPFNYFILHDTDNTWETGIGYLSASTTLVRNTITDNSSGTTSAINFASGGLTVIASPNSASLGYYPSYAFNHPDGRCVRSDIGDYNFTTTQTLTADRTYAHPFRCTAGMLVDQGKIEVTTFGTGNVKAAIYRLDQSGNARHRVASFITNTFSTATSNGIKTASIDEGEMYFPPGDYLACLISDGTAALRAAAAAEINAGHWQGFDSGGGNILPVRGLYSDTNSYATGLPEPLGATWLTSSSQNHPIIVLAHS